MAGFLGNILTGLGNVAQGVGNAIQNFSPSVQQFTQQADQALQRVPIVKGAEMVGQGIQNAANAFKPADGSDSFWTSPAAGILAGQKPVPQFKFAENIGQNVNNAVGGGIPGQVAGFGASILPGIAEGVLNVPSQIGQFATDTARDVSTNQLTPQHMISDAADLAQPLLTVGTLGEGAPWLKAIASDGWKTAVLKGLTGGMYVGGAFGLAGGLQQNRDAKTVGAQFEQSLPSVLSGMVQGGFLGSLIGPAGKFFFGGKPGQSAALAENGLVPPNALKDAYSILNVSPTASLEDIRGAYMNALNEFHPDTNGTPEALQVLNNAYEMTTRNPAPTLTGENGQFTPQWTDEMGGNTLSQEQIAQARRASANDTAFQARLENLRQGNVPVRGAGNGQISPDQFLEHGADLLTPEGQQELQGTTQRAAENQPVFHDTLSQVASDIGGKVVSNLKNPESIAQKVVEHRVNGEPTYNIQDVGDTLRGSIVVPSESDIPTAAQQLKGQFEANNWQQIGKDQNYFANPQKSGYQGYHINISLPDGQVAEVQIHTPESFAHAQLTHDAYSKFNEELPPEVKQATNDLKTKIKALPDEQVNKIVDEQRVKLQNTTLSPMESDFSKPTLTDQESSLPQEYISQIKRNLKGWQTDSAKSGILHALDGETAVQALTPEQYSAWERSHMQPVYNGWDQASTAGDLVTALLKKGNSDQAQDILNRVNDSPNDPRVQKLKAVYQDKINTTRNPAPTSSVDTPSAPTLTDQESGLMALRQTNPQLEYPEMQSQHLQNLTRMRDNLQQQMVAEPRVPQEVQGLVKMRDSAQEDLNQAQVILKNYDLYKARYGDIASKSDLRAQQSELKTNIKMIDRQVKDSQGKLEVRSTDTKARIKLQLADVQKQIEDEQSRLKIQQTLAQKNPADTTQTPIGSQEAPSAQLKGTPDAVTASEAKIPTGQTLTGKSLNEYDPTGLLKPAEQRLANTLLQTTPTDYGTGRDISKMQESRMDVASRDVHSVYQGMLKELPDKQSRSNVLYALDNSIDPKTLTPQEKAVFDRMQVLHSITFDVAQIAGHQDLQAIQHYAPSFATSVDKGSPYARTALSTNGPQVIHREIRAFSPVEGGATQVGTSQKLGLTPSGKSPGIFEDAQGNQFVARDATMKEKEGLGIRYETDLAKAEAQHFQNVLRAKENYGVRSALTGDKYVQMRSEPGQPMPAGFRKTTISGLEKYGWQKDVAKGLDQTIPQEKGDGLGNDLINLYNKTEQTLVRTGLMNPVGHVPNVTGQAMFAVSRENPITGVPRWLGNLGYGFKTMAHPDGDEYRYFKSLGSNIDHEVGGTNYMSNPSVAQKAGGVLSGIQKVVTAATWKYDTIAKTAAYKTLIDQGVDPREAVSFTDKYMGDYGNVNPGFEQAVAKYGTTFYPWLKTEMQPLMNAKKYPKALIGGLAWSMGTIAAVNAAYRQFTGNPDAKLNAPVAGTGKLMMDVAEQAPQFAQNIQQGKLQLPPVLYSHFLKPGAREIVQQATNYDLLRGKQIANPTDTNQLRLTARENHAMSLNPLTSQFTSAEQGKKMPAEAALSAFGFSTTPHLQGFQAMPNQPSASLIPFGPINQPGAKAGTGMDIIHTQNQVLAGLNSQQRANLQQVKTFEAQQDYAGADHLLMSDSKLFDAMSQMKQVEAKANGVPVDPTYDPKNKQIAQEYMRFSNMSQEEQTKYLTSNPDILSIERQRDIYNQNPLVQQSKQQQAQQLKYNYKPYTPNPLFATDQSGQPKFSNTDIAAYRVYQGMPSQSISDNATRQSFLANHPQVMAAQIANFPYQIQKLQTAWDSRPAGQSAAEFAATQKSSVFGGIDPQTGKVVPAYNLMDEPKYQLFAASPQAGTIYNVYKAAMANRDYTKADPLAAQYPWIAQVDAAQKAYTQAHPYNSEANGSLNGLGIDFSGTSTSKSGSGYSSGNYMQNYLTKEAAYNAMKDISTQFDQNVKSPKSPVAAQGVQLPRNQGDPLANYYKLQAQQGQRSVKLQEAPAPKIAPVKFGFKAPNDRISLSGRTKQPSAAPGRVTTKLH